MEIILKIGQNLIMVLKELSLQQEHVLEAIVISLIKLLLVEAMGDIRLLGTMCTLGQVQKFLEILK